MNIEKLNDISNEINNLLLKKNKDYGNSFFKSIDDFGIMSLIIRLTDKVNRLKNIYINKNIEIKLETIRDTILDIMGYSKLYLYKID